MRKIQLSDLQREHMRVVRKKFGITADQLSVYIGKSKGWYSQIENGRLQKIALYDLKLICDTLECSLCDLIGYGVDSAGNPNEYCGKDVEAIIKENIALNNEVKALKQKIKIIQSILGEEY